ncbi:MAG: hypothetical protein M3R21_03880 [Candidatus Dormibacteraeota bacterium]|nr:hypothetical protein [Candidatus Dormibacteraeota bacterium]
MRPGLLRLQERSGTWIAMPGVIVSGGPSDTLGVFLRFDPAAFGLALPTAAGVHHQPGGHVRTGLGAALSMDANDDRYNLGWASEVPDDPAEAIAMLASRLSSEPEPVSRHFLYAEFEGHLYGLRDSHPDGLRLFDEACAKHDSEMEAIRPALLATFHGLPLLEVYRRAAIRHQKAHAWDLAIRWARRGLAVYGEDALDSDNIVDLNYRVAKYAAKLDAERAPQPPPTRRLGIERVPSQPSEPVAVRMEELTCQVCGRTFERVRTRGRKPTRCDDCRQASV